jgi:membrane associated rhomboid family serine protease
MDGETGRSRVLLATALAAAAHLGLDAVTSRIAFTTPPYLLLDHANQAFRDLLMLDRTTVLVVVAVVSAGVNGAIAGLFGAALAPADRRLVKLGVALSGLWVFSGGLMILVYLSPPLGVALGSLAAGVPRSFAIAWVLDRTLPRPEPTAQR